MLTEHGKLSDAMVTLMYKYNNAMKKHLDCPLETLLSVSSIHMQTVFTVALFLPFGKITSGKPGGIYIGNFPSH